jgi:CheY-like chemotaxis protein
MTSELSPITKNVLLVDDERISLKLAQFILQEAGFSVSLADDGRTALASLEKNLPDIIVTDISMPDIDGLELISIIRKKGLNVPILALSGMSMNDLYLDAAKDFGATAILSKPVDRDQLINTVRKLLGMSNSSQLIL